VFFPSIPKEAGNHSSTCEFGCNRIAKQKKFIQTSTPVQGFPLRPREAAPRVRNISIDTFRDVATDSTGVLAVTLNIPQVSLQELF